MRGTDAVRVRDLVKSYRRDAPPAVDGISFGVPHGEVFGLLGPNGAGKTTTVGILTTRVLPTSGSATVDGVDVVSDPSTARRALAVVPQRSNLDQSLSARQNLVFHAAYHGIGRRERNRLADEMLERMGLADRHRAKVNAISGGQVQRIMIARALMHRPVVLFLDEPGTGLDPQARLFVHERIAELRDHGVTVVLTTHDMDEAEKLCDRIGIVDHGRLLDLDTPERLIAALPESTTFSVTVAAEHGGATPDGEQVELALNQVAGVGRVEPDVRGPDGSGLRFLLFAGAGASGVLPGVSKVLSDLHCEVLDFSVRRRGLEDVFIHMTGRELR